MSEDNNVIDLDDENRTVELETDDGQKVTFEYLDYIEFEQKEYVILLPIEDDEGSVVILEVRPLNEEEEEYLPVENEDVLNAVYELFKERNADLFDFEN